MEKKKQNRESIPLVQLHIGHSYGKGPTISLPEFSDSILENSKLLRVPSPFLRIHIHAVHYSFKDVLRLIF